MNRFVRYAPNRFSFSKLRSFAVLQTQLFVHDQDAALSSAAKIALTKQETMMERCTHNDAETFAYQRFTLRVIKRWCAAMITFEAAAGLGRT